LQQQFIVFKIKLSCELHEPPFRSCGSEWFSFEFSCKQALPS